MGNRAVLGHHWFHRIFFPTMEINGALKQASYKLSSKYLSLCSAEQRNSYRFGTTWGWVNDRIFIFGWTIPLRLQKSGAVPPHSTDKSTPPSLELSPPEHPHPHSCSPLGFAELCSSLGRKSWRTKRPEIKLFLSYLGRVCLFVCFIRLFIHSFFKRHASIKAIFTTSS